MHLLTLAAGFSVKLGWWPRLQQKFGQGKGQARPCSLAERGWSRSEVGAVRGPGSLHSSRGGSAENLTATRLPPSPARPAYSPAGLAVHRVTSDGMRRRRQNDGVNTIRVNVELILSLPLTLLAWWSAYCFLVVSCQKTLKQSAAPSLASQKWANCCVRVKSGLACSDWN